jgi:hypothetical protein
MAVSADGEHRMPVARPTTAPARMSKAALTRNFTSTTNATTASVVVHQFTSAPWATSIVTPVMSARAAAFKPSRAARPRRVLRTLPMTGRARATSTKDGRKIPTVATSAPGSPAIT